MSPSTSSFRRRSRSASYGPMISELRHVASVSVPETTYFVVSLKNGAPGSSSTVRVDHAGSNISYVVRPSRMARQRPVTAARCSPIFGSKPYSNVQDGSSMTPSRLMNSWTWTSPMSDLRFAGGGFRCAGADPFTTANSSACRGSLPPAPLDRAQQPGVHDPVAERPDGGHVDAAQAALGPDQHRHLAAVRARAVGDPAEVQHAVHGPVDELARPLVGQLVQRGEGGGGPSRCRCRAEVRRQPLAQRRCVAVAAGRA